MFRLKNQNYWLPLFIQTLGAVIFMWLVLFGLDKRLMGEKIILAAGASVLASIDGYF